MTDLFTSIKSHLDEVASAVAEVTRGISEYKRQIAELTPVAESLKSVVQQVNEKKAELLAFETKLKAAQAQHKRMLDTLQQV